MRVLNDLNTYITLGILIALYVYSEPSAEYEWWIKVVDAVPGGGGENDDRFKFVILAQTVLESAFWFLVINLTLFERIGWLERFRLQPVPEDAERKAKETDLTREAFVGVLVSHWIIRPAVFYFAWPYFEMRAGPLRSPIPSFRVLLPQILGCMMIDDAWFYFWHRLFHAVPFLYRTIHKQHHRFYRPNVFATEYAHPIEDLWVNSLGTILGPMVLGVHPLLLIAYPAMKLYQSMEAHSGFNIPFPFSVTSIIDSMDCAPAHDFHHSHNVGNFGGWTMVLDWVFGTDTKYENHVMVKMADKAAYETARRPYKHDRIGLVIKSSASSSTPRDKFE